MWDFAWASFYALPATSALLIIYQHGTRLFANRQSLERARFNARIVITLSTQMREFGAWNQHENTHS
jgi:hypothetical protein